jgi:carbon monoxide dehydrogenase subunit G
MNTLIEKKFDIEQPIDLVWKSLADPADIVTCVPGAAITEKVDDRNYKGEVVTKFGPIKAKYAGDIEIIELDEANKKMVLKGRGLDSKGKGSADMIMNGTLAESDGKTHVNFSMDITIVGMLAQFGSRLINDVSDQLLNQFVANFKKKLAASAPAATAAPSAPETNSNGLSDTNEAVSTSTSASKEIVSEVSATKSQSESTVEKVVEKLETKAAPVVEEEVDNAFDGTSLIGTVIKSIFGSIVDFFKGLFGGGKS